MILADHRGLKSLSFILVCFGFLKDVLFSLQANMKNKGAAVIVMLILALFFLTVEVNDVYALNLNTTEGPTSGNTSVIITGSFDSSAITNVYFGSAIVTSGLNVYSTSITVNTPSHVHGKVDVKVENGTNTYLCSNCFTYIPPPPTITGLFADQAGSISATQGPARGGKTVYIQGSNFIEGTTVKFDAGDDVAEWINSSAMLKCTTPPHVAGSITVTVTDPYNQSASKFYEYVTIPAAEKAALESWGINGPGNIECNWTNVTCNDDDTHVIAVDLSNNGLTSVFAITNFSMLETLNASQNQLTSLPTLPNSLTSLIAFENQLTSLPALPSNLISLNVSKNQLAELTSLPANLDTNGSDFSYNALNIITNTTLRNSLVSADSDWESTQTLPPTIDMNVVVESVEFDPNDASDNTTTENSIRLTWKKNTATNEGNGYKIEYATAVDGPFTLIKTVPDIGTLSESIKSLTACKSYYFRIRTYSDYIESVPTATITAKTLCIPYTEKQALTNLYKGLGYTDDEIWFAEPGMECSRTLTTQEVVCTSNSVTEIDLAGKSLSGYIHADIEKFTNLTTLDLSENSITDSIPTTIGTLGNLEYLNLSGNNLTGGIPAELGSLSKLRELYLQENSNLDKEVMKGIPSALGDLSNLEYLYLYSCGLDGSIPAALGNLSNLIELLT